MLKKIRNHKGIILVPDADALEGIEGEIKVGSISKKIETTLDGVAREILTNSQPATVTNKTLTSPVINTGVSGTAIDTDPNLAADSDILLASQKAVKAYVDAVAGAQNEASEIINVPAGTIAATNVQDAINELDGDIQGHINDTVDAHDASAISNVPSGNLAATDVQTALNELQSDVDTRATATALNDHINDTTDAHDASAISNIPSGNLAATDVQAALNELQSDVDVINNAGYVAGPASSGDNTVPRFDGTTGKLIQNSGMSIDDAGLISATAGASNLGGTQITSSTVTGIGGTLTLEGSGSTGVVSVNKKLTVVNKLTIGGIEDSTSTGSNVTIANPNASYIRFTNPNLVSISMIDATSSNGQKLIIENLTGNPITINNKTGATAANQIVTGSGGPLTLTNEASIELLYDGGTNSKWQVIGGTGSGGGQSLDTIFQLTGLDFTQWSTGNNATFLTAGTIAGTFAQETVAPLNGLSSYKFTQAAGSLNDWIASPVQNVPLRFRGQTNTVTFPFTYNGNNNDIVPVMYDVTNASIIFGSVNNDGYALQGTNGGVKNYQANFIIPLNCTQVRVGFQVKVLNSGKILQFDDIEVSSNLVVTDTFDTGSIGEVVPFASAIDSEYFLACDGRAVSRVEYYDLFLKIGTSHGQGDGSTTFNLPDYRGQFLRGRIAITNVTGSGSAASNQATFTNHGFNRTGLRVRLASGTLTGLAASTNYYVIVVDANTLAFATTRANALANTRIAISGTNTAVIQQWEDPDASTRLASNVGGNTGTNVGSIQEDEIKSHNHFVTFVATAVSGGSSVPGAGNQGTLNSGFFGGNETRPSNVTVNYGIRFRTNTSYIITPTESFSTDTALLSYKSSSEFTLTTLANATIGSYITFTYAANTNTRTQTTVRPTQTDADMNVNGIRIFTRAYNAASTAGNPACIAIQIGKGLKGKSLDLYKSVGKVTGGSLDMYGTSGGVVQSGAGYKEYNEITGILLVDVGVTYTDTVTDSQLRFSDLTTQNNGYLVINASKSPVLCGVPALIPRIATLSDVKASGTAGGTATAGSYQTRTLNTIDDPTGIVTSLSSNQWVLSKGEYYIEASAPAGACGNHKARLFNVTDSSVALLGSTKYSDNASFYADNNSTISGKIVITSNKTFEIQHRVGITRNVNGFGSASTFSDNEVYSIVKITKIKD
jgi:microcystin-dependent protein